PLHTRAMTTVNRWVSRNIIKESATENEAGERIGVFNKIFGYVYHVRLVGKRMKAWNSRVYYAVKYSIVGLILGGIVLSALMGSHSRRELRASNSPLVERDREGGACHSDGRGLLA